ncbi:MAG: hypothetical protein QOJ42_3536 [Acidobacteriaceae bacterium]|nr:hypothetical protein [Acidobacteriaceae bacterium]
MNRLLRPMPFHCVLMVLPCLIFCVAGNSEAQVQVTVSQGDCSEHSPCTSIAHSQEGNVPQLDVEGPQLIGPGQVAIVSTAGMVGLQDKAAVVKNEPYQAQAVTEMKQTLADGSHIVQTTTATVARDIDGRTVRVQKLGAMGPWKDSSSGNSQTLTTIFDPVAQEHIDYTSGSKVAHVFLMPSPPPGALVGAEGGFSVSVPSPLGVPEKGLIVSGSGPVGGALQGFAVQDRPFSPQLSKGVQPKTESLGTKTIDSVQVTGTRSTSTIPAGTIGNDRDLNIIRETWYSPELKLVVQSTQSDPRFGETTYTLKSIQQGSPDVTLFQVPANYTIDKIVPRFVKAPPQ